MHSVYLLERLFMVALIVTQMYVTYYYGYHNLYLAYVTAIGLWLSRLNDYRGGRAVVAKNSHG